MSKSAIQFEIESFLKAHPETERFEVLCVDLNGVLRGKWVPVGSASKLWSGDMRLPVSTSALNIWGVDVDASGLGIATGDKDAVLEPVPGSVLPVPWSKRPAAQILMQIGQRDGQRTLLDPRAQLASILNRLESSTGLTAVNFSPVVACELEFFLTAPRSTADARPMLPGFSGGSHLYDYVQMDRYGHIIEAIEDACAAQNIPADAVIAESGAGQFEINFKHQNDALIAADHAILFRRLVRGVARQHGLEATFMAKPYGDQPGSGMHVHASFLDGAGQNIFAQDLATLHHAVAGLLTHLPDCQLLFAPHSNSYRRYSLENFAPTAVNWGNDHRATSVRLPQCEGPAARFEHRVCGADVNPYLVLAAILGAAADGISQKLKPCPSVDDEPSAQMGVISPTWHGAQTAFEASSFIRKLFGEEFARIYAVVKADEIAQFNAQVTDVEYRTYLGRI